MKHSSFRTLLLGVFFWSAAGAFAVAPPVPDVSLSIVRTAKSSVRQGLLFQGGDFAHRVDTNFSAILVQHGDERFLFDSGLGSQVAAQYSQDMPLWMRPFFKYENPVSPVRQQLGHEEAAQIKRIVLSHAHWDHASGLSDFPQAEVLMSSEERGFVHEGKSAPGHPWPSQFRHQPFKAANIDFSGPPYEGFEKSCDLFKDGSVILVPMFGHTPGSVGMFVRLTSARRFFFVGDVVWNAAALADGKPKFWPARQIVDLDARATQASIERIRAVMKRDPQLVVVPAHDGDVQGRLGYFPQWQR